ASFARAHGSATPAASSSANCVRRAPDKSLLSPIKRGHGHFNEMDELSADYAAPDPLRVDPGEGFPRAQALALEQDARSVLVGISFDGVLNPDGSFAANIDDGAGPSKRKQEMTFFFDASYVDSSRRPGEDHIHKAFEVRYAENHFRTGDLAFP